MRDMEKLVRFTDTNTGETSERTFFVDNQFDEEKGYLFWSRKGCNKSYHDIRLPKELSWAERGRLEELSRYVYSNTNLLAYRGNGGIKPFKASHIAEKIELGERQTKRLLKRYIDCEVIAKVHIYVGDTKEEHYYMNPIYFFSSKRLPLSLYMIFKESLDKHLPSWVIGKFSEKESES